MKRRTYVDEEGNTINQSYENKKPLLRFFFVFGTVLPIIIIILIIIAVIQNNKCLNIYNTLKSASLKYAQDQGNLPTIEGENTSVRLDDLYNDQYLSSANTDNTLCSGTVKITKYKEDYVYTIDTRNCGQCSVNRKYNDWSSEQSSYPSGKAIVDVIPYYNYYERETNTTSWTDYFDDSELSDETSEYGIRLPLNEEDLPEIPTEGKIVNIENDTTYYYRYRNRSWKWYDIEGDYSEFSSEQPEGYANKDESSEIYTEWTEYSLDYPEEKDYRGIENTTGYKFYYLNDEGKKIYYNSGQYSAREDVNTDKYDKTDEDKTTLYRYRDKQWRWYNGTKRKYSSYSSTAPTGRPYKDTETETLGNATNWEEVLSEQTDNADYRIVERKLMTRFRIEYDISSLKVLDEPLNRSDFETKVKASIPEFYSNPNYKLEVSYKFRYRKS